VIRLAGRATHRGIVVDLAGWRVGGRGRGIHVGRRRCQQFATESESGVAAPVGEEAEVPDARETGRKDVQQEAAEERVGREGCELCVWIVATAAEPGVEGKPHGRRRDRVSAGQMTGPKVPRGMSKQPNSRSRLATSR